MNVPTYCPCRQCTPDVDAAYAGLSDARLTIHDLAVRLTHLHRYRDRFSKGDPERRRTFQLIEETECELAVRQMLAQTYTLASILANLETIAGTLERLEERR